MSMFEPLDITVLVQRFFYGEDVSPQATGNGEHVLVGPTDRDRLSPITERVVELAYYDGSKVHGATRANMTVFPFMTGSYRLKRVWADRNKRAPMDYVLRTHRPPGSLSPKDVLQMLESAKTPSKAVFGKSSDARERVVQLFARKMSAKEALAMFVSNGIATPLLLLFVRVSHISGDVLDVNFLRTLCSKGFDAEAAHKKLDRCENMTCPLCELCAGCAFNGVFRVGTEYYAGAYIVGDKGLHIRTSDDWVPVSRQVTGELLDIDHAVKRVF